MYVYMGHLKWNHLKPYEDNFWQKNRINLKLGFVKQVETEKKMLRFEAGDILKYDKLVIATGSNPNKFGWPGENLKGVRGLYTKQDLEYLEEFAPNNEICKRAVIVGGGLIGIELAEMLSTRNIPVTMLVREQHFWNNILPNEAAKLIDQHIREHHIDLRLETNLEEIKSDDNGKVKAVTIKESDEIINCNFVGLTAGVSPNIDFLKHSDIELNRGVLVNRFLETNIEDVFAIGDCAEQREAIGNRPPIEAVWYTGRMMGETLAYSLCHSKRKYQPGHWFNSAKFFDIEYQTYGWVLNTPKPGHTNFHWEDDTGKKSIQINYEISSRKFVGINTFGIRLRHEVFDQWMNKNASVDEVVQNLKTANFDPEFFKSYEKDIQNEFYKSQKNN